MPAERPPPPLPIGVLLSDENVCCQFNRLSKIVAQGKMAEENVSSGLRGRPSAEAGLGLFGYFTVN
jgi:hypothetical protein